MLRVPDTLNLKPEYGPTPPVVTLLSYDWPRRHPLDEVIAALGDADPTMPAASVVTTNPAPISHGHDVATRIKLTRAWLERQPPAVEGQRGDALTYRACCGAAHGHDLDEDAALDALRDWNARFSSILRSPMCAGKHDVSVRSASVSRK